MSDSMDFIPVSTPLLAGNEKKYLIDYIESGWISSEGPFVKKFEDMFAGYVGVGYGVSVTNGTAAIETALYAIGIEKDDEIIMPCFTIISCALACIRLGAKPVLVDIDPETWNMDVLQIEAKITPKTKAIMPVHKGLHDQPVLKKMGFFQNERYQLTDKAHEYGFYLPSGLTLTHEQIDKVIKALEIETGS